MANNDVAYSFDIKKSMSIVGYNKTVYVKLLKAFAESPLCGDLVSALEAGDAEVAKAKAHALKGVCGNMRFDMLFELVKAVEADMNGGALLTPGDARVTDLLAAHGKTLETVNRLIENPDMLAIA